MKTGFSGPVAVGVFTVAQAPSPKVGEDWTGAVAVFSNGAAGQPCLAFYNGTQWLRADNNLPISAT